MPHEKRQLKPGPKPGSMLSHRKPPPAPPVQKTFRGQPEFFEAVEERALQESLRLGTTVTFSDLVRRGLETVLDSELPPYVRGPRLPCALVRTASGGLACTVCMVSGGERKGSLLCRKLSREVKLGE
jgi:hypothetical protein